MYLKQKLLIFSMKFCRMPFSEKITFLCEMQGKPKSFNSFTKVLAPLVS